jgi:hypothetical protein
MMRWKEIIVVDHSDTAEAEWSGGKMVSIVETGVLVNERQQNQSERLVAKSKERQVKEYCLAFVPGLVQFLSGNGTPRYGIIFRRLDSHNSMLDLCAFLLQSNRRLQSCSASA